MRNNQFIYFFVLAESYSKHINTTLSVEAKLDHRISYLRAIACTLVILLHVSGEAFSTFSEHWIAANVYASLSRISVPLFFMISGALLLSKQESISLFFKKRASRVIPPAIFWSAVYCAWIFYWTRTVDWEIKLLNGQASFHLWYLYALVGMYLFVPTLRRLYCSGTNSEILLFLIIWALTSVYSCLNILLPEGLQNLLGGWHLWQFYGNVGYMLLGALLYDGRIIKSFSTISWSLLFLLSIFSTALLTHYYSYKISQPSQLFYSNLSLNVILASAAAFSLALKISRQPPILDKIATSISNCSLGIYGLHVLILGQLSANWGFSLYLWNPWVGPLISTIVTLAITYFIVLTLRFIPLVNRVA